ncbi:MAG: lytic transglycosylase domain-containing protein [Pseudomonadota bacterium]
MPRVALLLALSLALPALPSHSEVSINAADAMRVALQQVREDDWRSADVAAIPAGPVARTLVEWYRLREGEGTFDDYQSFLERYPDWPDIDRLRTAAETAIPPNMEPELVLGFFAGETPTTGPGVLRLIEAHEAMNHSGDAEALAVLAWRSMLLGSDAEAALLGQYRELLAPHHEARIDEMLWRGAENAVRRMYPRVSEGWQKLAEARLTLADQAPGVDARIEAVPDALQSQAGLAYERFNWRARRGLRDSAIELLNATSTTPEALGRPGRWANWRRIYARMMMREGNPELAYSLASRHFLVEGASFADLEWLSGYLALRYFDDPELALFHFDRFETAVVTPISLGRASYWRGRAYQALDDTVNASTAFREGARWQSSFYGLLSAEAAGIPIDPLLTGEESFPTINGSVLADSSVFQAAELLIAGGEPWRAEQFLRHLASVLEREEVGTLATALLELDEIHIALRVAKAAARNQVVVPAAYFPLTGAIDGDLPVERALALAIARRESEFDPVVVSPAGARGMMQLMPGTAQDVSRDLGIPYDRDGLTSDPAYNIRLGSTYLAELIDRFGPAPILVAVGYNAGPGRAVSWVADNGDPRSAGTDLVDWIEHIPFRETRNYVMRVTESVINYRARLSGETGPVRMLDYLRNG